MEDKQGTCEAILARPNGLADEQQARAMGVVIWAAVDKEKRKQELATKDTKKKKSHEDHEEGK